MPFHNEDLLRQRKKLFSVIITDLDNMIETELNDITAKDLKHKLIINLLNIIRIIKGLKHDSFNESVEYYVNRTIEIVDKATNAVSDKTVLEFSTTSTDLLDIKEDLWEMLQ